MFKFKNFTFKILVILFLTTIFIFIMAKSYSKIMFKNISSSFLRLHIVANSDSTEDQMLKYKIRDGILDYLEPYLKNVKSKQQAVYILEEHMDDISEVANNISHDLGYNYSIKTSIGNFYFPTKDYSSFTLPEGYYDALKIEIGNSCGQNWWCVMFPSVCIIDSTNCYFSEDSKKLLEDTVGYEEYNLISNQDEIPSLKLKFKLVELFENI